MIVILTAEVHFTLDQVEIIIPIGTEVFVDSSTNVAFYENRHFELFPDEYSPVH